MFKRLLITTILATLMPLVSCAKDYPIMQSQELIIPIKKRTIIELPFEIQDEIRVGVFTIKPDTKPSNDSIGDGIQPAPIVLNKQSPNSQELNLPTLNKTNSAQQNVAKKTIPEDGVVPKITKGVNNIEIFPSTAGDVDLTIWGYDKYPIVLRINISEADSNLTKQETYFVLKDYSKEESDVISGSSHIEAIAQMIYPMYEAKLKTNLNNDFCISGHKMTLPQWKMITTSNMELSSEFECSGARYASSKWTLTNLNKYPISVSEKEDIKDLKNNLKAYFRDIKRSIFAINIDTKKDYIDPNETVDVYIVSSVITKDGIKSAEKKEELKNAK